MLAWKRLLLTALLTFGLIAALLGLRRPYAHLAARHWQQELGRVSDDRAVVVLRQAAALDKPGIPVLVEALGSPRPRIARAGKTVLLGQIERWQLLDGRAASRRLAILARALAERVEQFDPAARTEAARFASRVLVWPLDGEAVDVSCVIGHCEQVLHSASVPSDVVIGRTQPQRESLGRSNAPAPGRDPLGRNDWMPHASSLVQSTALPGGELPVTPYSAPDGPQGAVRIADARAATPQRLAPQPEALPFYSGELPGSPSLVPQDTVVVPPSAQGRPVEDAPIRRMSSHDPMTVRRIEDLARLLTVGSEGSSALAAVELMRRGFTRRHVEVAARLFDSEPEIRRQTARRLPAEPGIDAAEWLLWLVDDPAVEVRLTAITLLATTSDRTLLGRVEQIARSDGDPRIRRIAEQISPQRRR